MNKFKFPILLLLTFTMIAFAVAFTQNKPSNLVPRTPVKASLTPSIASSHQVATPDLPVLQGATPGPIGPVGSTNTASDHDTNNGASPILYGETNGTIGPPAGDPVNLTTEDNRLKQNSLPITSLFIFSMAATIMIALCSQIKKNRTNALWLYGGVAAIVLILTGFIWGTTCSF